MRGVQNDGAAIDDEFVSFMETCVQCRGCEPACPSSVPFGALMEQTRTVLVDHRRMTPWWQRLGFAALARHRLLLVGSTLLAVAQRARLVPKRLGLGTIPLRRGPAIDSTGDDVWLFTGCVMDAWQRSTHRSLAGLIAASGATYRVSPAAAGCCGALHIHAGLHGDAVSLAERVIDSMPGDAPIVVDSAGCGASMKEYGHLVGTDAARRFSERVVDAAEWLAGRDLPAASTPSVESAVIVQDPCHLRHVQRVHGDVRTVLSQVTTVVELDDEGLCCGAGGAYSALQPELAGSIRDRKLASIDRAIERSGATVLASANPGCSMHLQTELESRGITVRHPVDIVADALGVSVGGDSA